MYIAIEGIKGTGKSSILNHVHSLAVLNGLRYKLYPITSEIPCSNKLESLHHFFPAIKQNDIYIEKLFIERARWHQKYINFNRGLVLGDRSILTSYVTRWNKWGDPYFTINRVEAMQKDIQKPGVILLIKGDPEKSSQNIHKREKKAIGSNEEQLQKLKEASAIYEELLQQKLYMRKIKQTQLINLPASATIYEVANEIISIIKFYNN